MVVALAVSAPAAFAAPPDPIEHCLKYFNQGEELFDKAIARGDIDKAVEFYEKGENKSVACLDKL